MTDSLSVLNTPVLWINTYLQEKLADFLPQPGSQNELIPFFPTGPSTIEALQTSFPEGGAMAVYDRMFKMRRTPFPYIKCEQLLYYFYSVGEAAQANMIKVQQQVSDLLDNADDSAQDLNEWAVANLDYETLESKPVYFHNFKIYQLEETRDIVDFGTARTYARNKIIIDYDWHPLELNP